MSILSVYHHGMPEEPFKVLTHHEDIAATLAEVGVQLQHWQAATAIGPDSDDEALVAAYQPQLDHLMSECSHAVVQVIRLSEDRYRPGTTREQALEEYVLADDEVRLFVAGRGQFNLHVAERIYAVLCEKGDLIRIPAGTRHWFDQGEVPHLVAIRLLATAEGSTPQPTGDDIASRFPRLED